MKIGKAQEMTDFELGALKNMLVNSRK